MYRRSPQGWAKHWDFILLDVVAVFFSFFLAYRIRQGNWNPFATDLYRTLGFVILLMDVLVSILFNTFSGVLKRGYYKTFIDTARHTFMVMLLNILFSFVMQTGEAYSRIVVFLTAGFHLLLGYGLKMIYRHFRHSRKKPERTMFLVSTSDRAEDAILSLQNNSTDPVQVTGAAIIDQSMIGQNINGVPIVADRENVIPYLTREWVDEIFFRVPRQSEDHDKLFSAFLEMGITVHVDIGTLSVVTNQKQEVERIGKSLVLTTAINTITGWNAVAKRLLDIVGGLIGSVFALLIMGIVAIPIKKASPGPLLYTSDRIGLNGKHFRMYKIRSMYLDADAKKAELMKDNRVKDGMMFKLDWDPRIIGNRTLPDGTRKTGIGEFIRKTSLDEFPQFFNVLKGDMSLVGTRPPTPDEWAKYEAHHRARMATKPGITGMWQANGRSEITDFEEVVRLDTEYITNWNFGLDIKLLLKTMGAVIFRRGAL